MNIKNNITTIAAIAAVVSLAATGFISYALNTDKNEIKTITSPAASITETETETAAAAVNIPKVTGRKLETAVSSISATKDDIYHIMLNSIDYYDKVSGAVYFPSDNTCNKIEFQTILSESKAFSHHTQYNADMSKSISVDAVDSMADTNDVIYDTEMYCDGESSCISIDNTEKTYASDPGYVITLDSVLDIPDDERITIESDGNPCYNLRTNPTNVPEASISLFPQEMTFGFLKNNELWDIEGIEKYDGKECYHITGKTEEEYGNKLNVSEFDFMVDVNTGVLLQYIGYDEYGNISDYMYTDDISFEESAKNVKEFSENLITSYQCMN